MNYSNLNSILHACIRLDHGFRQKLFQNWCKNQGLEKPKLSMSFNARNFCSSEETTQGHNDDTTVLPSPQEASKFLHIPNKIPMSVIWFLLYLIF